MAKAQGDNRRYLRIIYAISILIPLVVAILLFLPSKLDLDITWVKMLPGFHALVNSLTVVVLLAALIAIKKQNIELHRKLMMSAFFLGLLFLISYVLYHSSVDSVKFGDLDHDGIVSSEEKEIAGGTRMMYLGILASHILLSIAVVPFVLLAFYYALTDQINKHKKIVKFTFPVWMYVSITGVIVYLLIKPYYF